MQWQQALERNEDDAGKQEHPDVEESQDDADEFYDDPPSPMTPWSGESVGRWIYALIRMLRH